MSIGTIGFLLIGAGIGIFYLLRGINYIKRLQKEARQYRSLAAAHIWRIVEEPALEPERIAASKDTPPWLLRLYYKLSEQERKRLSQDLHDGALQEQIIWLRKLQMIRSRPETPERLKDELGGICEGLADVVFEIRQTCQELRPPLIKELGLVSALGRLFDDTQKYADFTVFFDAAGFRATLNDEQTICIYRVVQELLANAAKHSNASHLDFELAGDELLVLLTYRDNGIGMNIPEAGQSPDTMGLRGIRERVGSLNGSIEYASPPKKGLSAHIRIPLLAGKYAL